MKKIIWPGLLAGIVMLVLGMIVSYAFMIIPSVSADYQNTGLMRSWQDPLMMLFFLVYFIEGIIYAWVWNKTRVLFKGTSVRRGTMFGLSIWLVAMIPGMFISYTSFPLSLLTILSWTVSGLINTIVAGLIFAKMNK